jgi:hypothetical protein
MIIYKYLKYLLYWISDRIMSNNKFLSAIPKALFIFLFILSISIIESQDIYFTPYLNSHATGFKPQSTLQYDVSGMWNMVGNEAFQFDLKLQQNDNMITGTMTRTNGQEPVDTISGFVYPSGKIVFNRARPGVFTQVYTGQISGIGSSLSIDGTFTQDGEGQYPWSASKNENQTLESPTSGSAINYNEALLSPGWDVFSEPLFNGKLQWAVLDNGNLQVIFELNGASPNHRYIAGSHFFDPGGLGQMPGVCQFGGTKIVCDRGPLTRDGVTATGLGAWDFGYLDTNGNGYGKAQFTLSPPSGTYYTQFTVRIGDQCDLSIGATSGCAVVYRTGTKMGQRFEKIVIPSTSLQYPTGISLPVVQTIVQAPNIQSEFSSAKTPIVEAPVEPIVATENGQCDWTGTWDTEFGQIILQQSGESITGSYSKNGVQGQIQGTVSESVLSGSWTGANSEGGTFRFTMEDDCQFAGDWYSKDTGIQEDEGLYAPQGVGQGKIGMSKDTSIQEDEGLYASQGVGQEKIGMQSEKVRGKKRTSKHN